MTYKEICDDLPVGELENTDASPFWYHTQYEGTADAKYRYHHEDGKVGDTFYDGNNGDRWRVLAINRQWRRIVVENKTQGGVRLCFWQ